MQKIKEPSRKQIQEKQLKAKKSIDKNKYQRFRITSGMIVLHIVVLLFCPIIAFLSLIDNSRDV